MRTVAPLLAIALMAASCGSLQTTTQVRDDVYDIPDRTAIAAAGGGSIAEDTGMPEGFVEDYYDPNDKGNYDLGSSNGRSYEDITYNDPQYYNYDRFRFNVGVNTWGPAYGMGMNFGAPGMFGDPWNNPYYTNSWMSGYGAWGSPWYGSGWNMGSSMFWGNPYGGYPGFYGGYPGFYGGYPGFYGGLPMGGGGFFPPCCFGNGDFYGNNTVYQHRPAFGGGQSGGGTVIAPVPEQYRPNSLMRTRPSNSANEVRQGTRTVTGTPGERSKMQRTEGQRGGNGGQQRMERSGGSRGGGGAPGGGSPGGGGGGGSRPSTGGGRR